MAAITKYENEFLDMMSELNGQMMDLSGADLMSDEALRQLSEIQKEQWVKTKGILEAVRKLMKSEYYKKRRGDETSIENKRMTETQKRADAKANPEKYFICQRCDSIFTRKENLQRHQANALKCPVIKQGKKGTLEIKNHRSIKINNFILEHLADADSSGEEDNVEE
jgi:uncharacterized C2H2 Zn-finger protein